MSEVPPTGAGAPRALCVGVSSWSPGTRNFPARSSLLLLLLARPLPIATACPLPLPSEAAGLPRAWPSLLLPAAASCTALAVTPVRAAAFCNAFESSLLLSPPSCSASDSSPLRAALPCHARKSCPPRAAAACSELGPSQPRASGCCPPCDVTPAASDPERGADEGPSEERVWVVCFAPDTPTAENPLFLTDHREHVHASLRLGTNANLTQERAISWLPPLYGTFLRAV